MSLNKLILITLFCHISPLWALPAADEAKIKGAMQQIYQNMSVLLPMSLNDKVFHSPEKASSIKKSLEQLQQSSQQLEEYTKPLKDEAINLIGEEFHYFSKEAAKAFTHDQKSRAQALIQFQTEACMACHTMRTSTSEPRLALGFLSDINYSNLGTWEKARFLTMVRQFDASMSEYERLLGSDHLASEEKLLSNAYNEYLILGLRVTENLPRVKLFLQKIVKQPEPHLVRESLKIWLKDIEMVEKLPQPWTGKTAKQLIELGSQGNKYPADPQGIVYYIVASKILRQQLDRETPPKTPAVLAEYNYLLGKSELVVDHFGFKALRYFAKAIKLSPQSAVAKQALELYQLHLELNYSGSSGTNIPSDEKARLNRLIRLVKGKL